MGGQRRALIASGGALLGGAAALAYAVWWRKNPSACPYKQHFWLEVPHPFLTRARLRRILAPQPGERTLEVGPGTGYYSLDIAEQIAPDGVLDILRSTEDARSHDAQGEQAPHHKYCPHSGRCPRATLPRRHLRRRLHDSDPRRSPRPGRRPTRTASGLE